MRWLRWLRWTLLCLAVVAAIASGFAWWALKQSLPPLDGDAHGPGLAAETRIERDARGTVTITASSRSDLAYATGYAHAQDRFFQMDLSRRLAAGELAELFGTVAVGQDTRTRRFGFRNVARRVIAATPADERTVIDAYARGVNAGLEALAGRPWEYLLLRAQPRPWLPEDSVLVVHSMWWQLQHSTLLAEVDRRRLERAAATTATPEAARELIAFVYAGHTVWDTPNYSAEAPCMRSACQETAPVTTATFPAMLRFGKLASAAVAAGDEPATPGSNNWAVAGAHTQSGVALVANDMHLDLGVPAVWYPARLRVTGAQSLDVMGVSLPGTPAIAAGSNGQVAWGFTNSYGDFADVRWGACSSPNQRIRRERIAVRGMDEVEVEFRDLEFGVVLDGAEFVGKRVGDECLHAAWIASRPEATNFGLLTLERARTVGEVLELAPGVGIPGQNLVVGDAAGRIAWTLLGRVPRSAGPDRFFGSLEYRDATDHPRIADPPVGRLWTANQRVVDGELEAVLGDDEVDVGAGGYDVGARARQIRDGLLGLPHPATEADMLAIQLDARGRFLARWRDLLLEQLDGDAMRDAPHRREFRELVSAGALDAEPSQIGYRLVRTFRANAQEALWSALVAGLLGEDENVRRPGQFEAAAWRLLKERPAAIQPPGGGDWRAFLLTRVDATIATLLEECAALADCSYGQRRPVEVRHPLSGAVPGLSRLLDMPTRELPGDHHMPRVQDGSFGASERFAVSPGRESRGYLQLPGGPSGHPLSPFYRSGYDDWARGVATPFLPGPTVHAFVLRPRPAQ